MLDTSTVDLKDWVARLGRSVGSGMSIVTPQPVKNFLLAISLMG
jgi:hypothetical protein